MNLNALTKLAIASTLVWSFSTQAGLMHIDTSATGSLSPGDAGYQVADTLFFSGKLGTDSDPITGAFDSMTFEISPTEDLTTISQTSIDTLRLDGTSLKAYGANESIGVYESDLDLYVVWDNIQGPSGNIRYWFSDPNDTGDAVDTLVASGIIASLTETSLVADLDFLLAGFWLDENKKEIAASITDAYRIAMTVQAGGSSGDIRAVPEPSILALFSLGLVGMGIGYRKKTKS